MLCDSRQVGANNGSQNMDSLHQLLWMPVKIQILGPCIRTTEPEFLGVTLETHILMSSLQFEIYGFQDVTVIVRREMANRFHPDC